MYTSLGASLQKNISARIISPRTDNMNSTNTADNTLGIEKLSKASFIMTLCLNAPMASFGIFGNIFTLVMLMRKVIPGTDSLRLKLIHLTIVDLVLVMQMTIVIGSKSTVT